MKQRYPLHTFVRRILLRRLILVALAVSLLVGGWTWIHERNLAQERVVKVALDRLAIIRAEFFHLVSSGVSRDEAVPLAINSLGDMEFDLSGGAFAAAVFYDRNDDFHVFGDTTQAACRDALSLLGQDRSRQPELGQQFHSLVRVTGRRAVHIVVPIANREGQLASWVRAVYLLSPSASAVLIREPLTSVGLVILIVLSISALFYPVVLRMSRRLAGFSADLLEANLEMMEALGCAIAKRDGDTDAHNYRVTIYSVRLAEKEGLSLQAIQGLIKGAFLHDIGKIGIRDDVLLKPGRLTEDEYEIMKTHVNHGLDIVGRARWLHDALAVVGSHHEKFGGDGYPDRIPGNMIPSAARIFAITDVFDALSSERPYKKPMPLAKVVEILEEGRDQHFDPALLDSFLEIAPDLHAELNHFGTNELRVEMHEINSRYFASSLETMLV
jgi:HD-GYP domain-containing protein (c-di-GMP phosphodiesterase class II)